MDYRELNAKAPEEFLNPENFRTSFDRDNSGQFEKGMSISNESIEVGVSACGTWYAKGKDNSCTNYSESPLPKGRCF